MCASQVLALLLNQWLRAGRGKCVCLFVLGPWNVVDQELEPQEEEDPSRLLGHQSLSHLQILQVLVIGEGSPGRFRGPGGGPGSDSTESYLPSLECQDDDSAGSYLSCLDYQGGYDDYGKALPRVCLCRACKHPKHVQSLDNKLNDLQARITFQRDIRDSSILCFTESWLNPAVPNHAIQPLKFFSVHRMDRTADSGKLRGGGVCVMVNNSWCNNGNVVTLARSCSPNLELLALKFHPFYLPWEFTSVIINTMYIPPQANMDTALCELHEALTQFQAQHRDAALIVVGDFNSANLKREVPNLYQHITFPTRGNRTLDHCYTPYKDSYKALAHPPFGKSDHAAIFHLPKYKQRLKREAPVQREVSANGTIGAANGACAEPTIEQHPLIITESDVRRVF
ncbi:hypothetical protein P4O66_017905 [Electrophorus voltai]|uniref:Endonuclease/exonuclease/phosphatase domain-containing protein n=1 Tax=Electrophorus voltai TaxID=2609070 RepID=A0AAD8YUJ0_9TELE|nr:hypothetical protein P4O66_017905 [Electrophorus voltai]